MKIILIHYRYYEASGPEKYLFNISNLLEENGHIVIPFSLNYPQNNKTTYSQYFPQPLIENFHINKNKSSISFGLKLKIIHNSFFNKKVFSNLSGLIEKEKPDIVFVLQYGTKLSTSIFDACSKYKVPIVVRVSDYNLICAKNIFFRNDKICTKCIDNKLYSVKFSCVHNSFTQSFTYYLIQKYNQIRKFEKQIDAFIAPSNFTIKLLKSNKQFASCDFYHIPTFIESSNSSNNLYHRNYNIVNGLKLCYWGRIDDDKGIDILIDAVKVVSQKGFKLSVKIIGDINSEFAQKQIKRTKELGLDNISFLGYVPNQKIFEEIKDVHFSVIPSKWYDNMPNSLIESCAFGIPVIVSNIGSLEELISEGVNGFLFNPSNPLDLATKIESLFNLNENNYNDISAFCIKWINEYCDRNSHYQKLIHVFNKIINEKNCN